MPHTSRGFLGALGPGLLLAGAAVGVSHLVQSTRAGAAYGFSLIALVILANLAKYPAFRFGPQYAAATGTSLLSGYRKQGLWALVLYALLTLATMFTVLAAVAFVTAGLAKNLFGLEQSPQVITAVLIAVCAGLLSSGKFGWLDALNKVVVLVFTIATLIATALLLPHVDWSIMSFWPDWSTVETKDVLFMAALVGWMPSAIDISVWHSLWTLAKADDNGHRPSVRQAMSDFHLGYWGTVLLALCFITLGAGVMFGKDVAFAKGASGFAAQIVGLYVDTLGDWSRPIISACAFAVMFSTTLTVVDGFPRAIATLVARFRSDEQPWSAPLSQRKAYWAGLVVVSVGALLVVNFLLKSLTTLVDVATTASFLTAPVLAWLNHRAMHGSEVAADARPARWLTLSSWAGIVLLAAFAVYYLSLLATR